MLEIDRSSSRLAKDAALLPMRAALGGSMLFHGLSKLKGEGPAKTGQMFEQLGLQPGKGLAVATGLAEVFAGASSVLGFLTRPAALAVLVTQAVAIAKVHSDKGYDITKGGMEYNLTLMAIALGLLVAGPGEASLHEAVETLSRGRGAKGLWRRARPSMWMRAVCALK